MFGDMMGNMEEKQKALRDQLAKVTIEESAGDGAVRVTANANREILNVKVDATQLDLSEDTEQLEDLLVVAINRVLEKAAETEAEASQQLIRDMMPPGMGDLGSLFGG